jgi:hypothetical protein
MTSRYCIGIDLGTTHSVVAFTPLDVEQAELSLLMIPQAVAAGQVDSFPSLPSFLYLATEVEENAYQAPWEVSRPSRRQIAGEAARGKAAESPQRVVATAKSWLAHAGVDRHAAILPWQAPDEVGKVSPVEATQAYLRHLAAAWNHAHPEAPIAQQQVVLTVPASFDPAARDLTRQAALAAGLPDDLVLLEEPQAAVYRWVEGKGEAWRRELAAGDSILVIDVGGGTTDLTLVRLSEIDGNVELERQAIGNHLLVGGDNMDLALAFLVSQKLEREGHRLDPWQNVSLWHACRAAKERLLSAAETPDAKGLAKPPKGTRGQRDLTATATETISVLGRGSRLIGGTISTELERGEAAELLLSGFFPPCAVHEKPTRAVSSGFQDLGLPYESDPAITRHVAAFLAGQKPTDSGQTAAIPTHLLFNGGVFQAPILRDRVREVITSWAEGKSPDVLGGPEDLDHAVALGAAYYGWSKLRGGIRIRGGTARSYYIGIETAGLAIPGAPRPLRALCIAPRGMEEGTEAEVPSQEVGIIVGRPAQFRFFSSTVRPDDQPGMSLDRWSPEELIESDPIHTTLDSDQCDQGTCLPVRFQCRVTELGMFELYCLSTRTAERWKMDFNVREEGDA